MLIGQIGWEKIDLIRALLVAVVIRILIDILFFSDCIVHLIGGPLEKQLQLKSQPP